MAIASSRHLKSPQALRSAMSVWLTLVFGGCPLCGCTHGRVQLQQVVVAASRAIHRRLVGVKRFLCSAYLSCAGNVNIIQPGLTVTVQVARVGTRTARKQSDSLIGIGKRTVRRCEMLINEKRSFRERNCRANCFLMICSSCLTVKCANCKFSHRDFPR